MPESTTSPPEDLRGTADERMAQLAEWDAAGGALSPEWLRRQLDATLAAWAQDETTLDIEKDAHTDF
ncbi:hypothetical protein NQ152_02885 [Microbacterium sp. zg.B48]|uniref:hypothetical protein n=1 Tax=Microbacterium sp. zg.B48 TaxID=2969408 RepID=UPI00214B6355|nr:hypothetical protein [Microbacterium sp. zg.B48]MCR2762449.1 hypothetical protein [Microbacterium sp. zg.B48]